MLKDPVLRQHLSAPAHEQVEQPEFLLAQPGGRAGKFNRVLDRVEHNPVAFKAGKPGAAVPPHQRVEPGQQFLETDRLDYEIVGPGIQAFDLFLPAAAGGQDQDRGGQPGRPPTAQQVKAIAIGQAEIEQDHVDPVQFRPCLSLFGAARQIDGKADRAQPLGQAWTQFGIIFDHQQSHRVLFLASAGFFPGR